MTGKVTCRYCSRKISGEGFGKQGSSPCTAFFFPQLFDLECSFLENEQIKLPSTFKGISSSQFICKFYLEHGKQGEVRAGNFPNWHILGFKNP